jgi:hypothetical protein
MAAEDNRYHIYVLSIDIIYMYSLLENTSVQNHLVHISVMYNSSKKLVRQCV